MKTNSFLIYLFVLALFTWKIGSSAATMIEKGQERKAAAIAKVLQDIE